MLQLVWNGAPFEILTWSLHGVRVKKMIVWLILASFCEGADVTGSAGGAAEVGFTESRWCLDGSAAVQLRCKDLIYLGLIRFVFLLLVLCTCFVAVFAFVVICLFIVAFYYYIFNKSAHRCDQSCSGHFLSFAESNSVSWPRSSFSSLGMLENSQASAIRRCLFWTWWHVAFYSRLTLRANSELSLPK